MKFLQRVATLVVMMLLAAGCGPITRLSPSPSPESDQPLAIIQNQIQVENTPTRLFLPIVSRPLPEPVPPPGKEPVGGGHSLPRWTSSYYIMSYGAQANFNLGCELGLEDLNTPGIQDNLVVLDFGAPKQVNGAYGASMMQVSGFGSVDQIASAVENFGWGYYVCSGSDMQSHLRIGIGTNNYPARYNASVTYEHGRAWAQMVNQVNDWLRVNTTNSIGQQVDAVGANDLELSWNSYTASRAWLDGYDTANWYAMYNFGALPGCPWLSRPGSQCGSYPYVWSKEEVWYAIYGSGPVYSLPEIYRTDGINAEQWYLMSVYAYQTHGAPVGFVGAMTTYQACLQEGGCRFGSWGIDNTPQQGWSQLYNLLNGDARTAQGLRWITDIVWTNTSGVVYGLSSDALESPEAQISAQEKDQFVQAELQTTLQTAALSEAARAGLQEKLALAEHAAQPPDVTSPAPKERPGDQEFQLQGQSLAQSLAESGELIVEGSEGLLRPSQATINNLWTGVFEGAALQVLAGAMPENPEQGIVVVIQPSENELLPERKIFLGPSYTGGLRILERQDNLLILQAVNGSILHFDLSARAFTQ